MKPTPNNIRGGSPTTTPTTTDVAAINRRQFLTRSVGLTAAAALWSALGTRSRAATAAGGSDAPEMPNVKIGIIAFTDCSPIVIAREKGFFKKYGINATITKGANWAAIRDNPPPAPSRPRACSSACRSPRPWASPVRRKKPWSSRGCSTATARPSR